jgi:hypothetical protein
MSKRKNQMNMIHATLNITEIEGEREVEGPSLESEAFSTPIKVKKFNIGTEENLKWKALETN